MLVAFGNASGPVPPMDVLTLPRNGSLFLTRPTLGDYIVERQPGAAGQELFDWIGSVDSLSPSSTAYPLGQQPRLTGRSRAQDHGEGAAEY